VVPDEGVGGLEPDSLPEHFRCHEGMLTFLEGLQGQGIACGQP